MLGRSVRVSVSGRLRVTYVVDSLDPAPLTVVSGTGVRVTVVVPIVMLPVGVKPVNQLVVLFCIESQ